MVNAKQKPTVSIQKMKRKECNLTSKESHQTTKEESKGRRNRDELQKQPVKKLTERQQVHTYQQLLKCKWTKISNQKTQSG